MKDLRPAEKLLVSLGITKPEEIDLEAISMHCGALVKYDNLEGCEARIIGKGDKAIITIKSDNYPARKRFSLGHELGHWHHHKGKAFVCRKEDIGSSPISPKLADAKLDPEKVADRYSADLLLPRYIFKPLSNSLDKPTFENIKKLADAFKCSQLATAIRFIQYSSFPCLLICHNKNGRQWFVRNDDVIPNKFFPKADLDSESDTFEIVYGNKEKGNRTIIGADAWFDFRGAEDCDLYEESIRTTENQALTLLTFKDVDVLE